MNADFIAALFYSIEKEQLQKLLDFYFFETQGWTSGHVKLVEFSLRNEIWVYLIADEDWELLESRMKELSDAAIGTGLFERVTFEYAVLKTKYEWEVSE